MIYHCIRHADTFETFLNCLDARQITVMDLEYDDYRVEQYDHGNPLWMSMKDLTEEHLRVVIACPDTTSGITFEWKGGHHSVSYEKKM